MGSDDARHSAGAVLRGLVRPLYLPSALYSVGVGAAIPAQVLVGVEAGLAPATVALLVAWSGVAMVVGSWAAGPVVDRFGECRALVVATAAGVIPVVLLCCLLWWRLPGVVVAYAVTLAAFNLSDGVWGVARQELMAAWVPPRMRGRAVNTYGASQRSGRLVGPFVGAALIAVMGPVAGFVVFALASVVGLTALLSAAEPPHPGSDGAPAGPSHAEGVDGEGRPLPRSARRAFWIVGAGVLALVIVRMQQEVLVPLWASEAMHLAPAAVSLAMGVLMTLEMVLFYPAGIVLDRIGSLPVICTCMVVVSAGFALLLVPGWFWPAICVIGLGGGIGSGIVKTIGIELAPEIGRPRFLGRWMALSSVGAVLGPLLVAATGRSSLGLAVGSTVLIGLGGAAWLAVAARPFLVARRSLPS